MPMSLTKLGPPEAGFIWSRLVLQSSELLRATSLGKAAVDDLVSACAECAHRLTDCHSTLARLSAYRLRVLDDWSRNGKRVTPLVHLEPVRPDAERFLYEAKNCLRDATAFLRYGFGLPVDEASSFGGLAKREKDAVKLLLPVVGEAHDLIRFLRSNQPWLSELIAMRNAVEHPGGRSGRLITDNFVFPANGQVSRPQWYRDQSPPSLLIEEAAELFGLLLMFCEELMAYVAKHHAASPHLRVTEDPAARGTELPRRFHIVFDVPSAPE